MEDKMGIKTQSLGEQLTDGTLSQGYVKVCASWFKDIWNGKDYYEDHLDFEDFNGKKDMMLFGKPTVSFDHCGINDI
jgi:hypothetical protein